MDFFFLYWKSNTIKRKSGRKREKESQVIPEVNNERNKKDKATSGITWHSPLLYLVLVSYQPLLELGSKKRKAPSMAEETMTRERRVVT